MAHTSQYICKTRKAVNQFALRSLLENPDAYWSEFFREDQNLYYLTLQLPDMNITDPASRPALELMFPIWIKDPQFFFNAHPPNQFWYGKEDAYGEHRRFIDLSTISVIPGANLAITYSYYLTRSIQMEEKTRCDVTNRKLLDSCVRSFVENKLGCKLPWMGDRLSSNIHIQNTCTEEQQANVTSIFEGISGPDATKLNVRGTDCSIPCDLYLPKLTMEMQSFNRTALPQLKDTGVATLTISVSTNQMTVAEEEIVLMYDSLDAMADIGGFLGLLLGASCWSIASSALNRAKNLILSHKKDFKNLVLPVCRPFIDFFG